MLTAPRPALPPGPYPQTPTPQPAPAQSFPVPGSQMDAQPLLRPTCALQGHLRAAQGQHQVISPKGGCRGHRDKSGVVRAVHGAEVVAENVADLTGRSHGAPWEGGKAGEAGTLPHPQASLLLPGLGQLEPQGQEGRPLLGQALLQKGSRVSEWGGSVWGGGHQARFPALPTWVHGWDRPSRPLRPSSRQDTARHSRSRRFRSRFRPELHQPFPDPPGQVGVLPWQLRVWQAGQGQPVEEIQGRGGSQVAEAPAALPARSAGALELRPHPGLYRRPW